MDTQFFCIFEHVFVSKISKFTYFYNFRPAFSRIFFGVGRILYLRISMCINKLICTEFVKINLLVGYL